MVEGFDLETAPLTEEEKRLVPIIIKGLAKRTDSTQAIYGAAICKAISEKYGTKLTEPRLRKITNFVRSAKILPIIATNKGYYVSHDKEEIKMQILSLQQRQEAIQQAINGLQKWL